MNNPRTPFSTRLSGSAKETELRIRNIVQWKKKRLPVALFVLTLVVLSSCFGLFSCTPQAELPEESPVAEHPSVTEQSPAAEQTPATETTQPSLPEGEETFPENNYVLHAGERQLTLELAAEKLPDRYYYRVEELRVYDGDDLLSAVQTADLSYEGDYLFEGVFFLRGKDFSWEPIVADFNFDSCDDLCLMASDHGPKNIPFAYFLWNDAEHRLEFSFVLSNPLTVDTENRCLIESTVGPAGIYEQRNTYQFDEQGKLNLMDVTTIYNGPMTSKVDVFIEAEPAIKEPMECLTPEQKDLLANLPVDELPRQAVDLRSLWRSQVWQQTLIPFAHNEENDVTLYGVVSADSQFFHGDSELRGLDADGIVLRAGDRAVYAPMPWWDNAYLQYNPWMEIDDFDGDGKPEAAVCTHYGRGTGVNLEALYLFDLDTMTWSVPNFTTLDIDTIYDPDTHSIALTAGECSAVMKLESHQIPPISCGNRVSFSYENGQLLCTIGLESYGYGIGAFAKAVVPITWDINHCYLDEVISLNAS